LGGEHAPEESLAMAFDGCRNARDVDDVYASGEHSAPLKGFWGLSIVAAAHAAIDKAQLAHLARLI